MYLEPKVRKELGDLLCDKYPKIFAERHMDTSSSCMGWGLDCGDGWFDIIDTLCANLQSMTDRNAAPQVVAKQVKEKFGNLCFLYSGGNEVTFGMVMLAQSMSVRVCEMCGGPRPRKAENGGLQVRCAHPPCYYQTDLDSDDFPEE